MRNLFPVSAVLVRLNRVDDGENAENVGDGVANAIVNLVIAANAVCGKDADNDDISGEVEEGTENNHDFEEDDDGSGGENNEVGNNEVKNNQWIPDSNVLLRSPRRRTDRHRLAYKMCVICDKTFNTNFDEDLCSKCLHTMQK